MKITPRKKVSRRVGITSGLKWKLIKIRNRTANLAIFISNKDNWNKTQQISALFANLLVCLLEISDQANKICKVLFEQEDGEVLHISQEDYFKLVGKQKEKDEDKDENIFYKIF